MVIKLQKRQVDQKCSLKSIKQFYSFVWKLHDKLFFHRLHIWNCMIRSFLLWTSTRESRHIVSQIVNSVDLYYPDKRCQLEHNNEFFSNWVDFRWNMIEPKLFQSFSKINMVQLVLWNFGSKFYHKNGSLLNFLNKQKLRYNYWVDHWHYYINVNILRAQFLFWKNLLCKK